MTDLPTDLPLPSDELVDLAYDAMCAELNLWQVVGPLEDRPNKQEYWNAIRTETNALGHMVPVIHHLSSRQHAVACMQWHGLRAALAAFRGELAPIASNESSNDNG